MTTNPKNQLSEVEKAILKVATPEKTCPEIAHEAGVYLQAVYRAVRKFKLTVSTLKKELTDEQKETIRSLASPETGAKSIANKVGCTWYQIISFMEQEGLPRKRIAEKTYYNPTGSDIFCWEDFQNSVI